MNKVKFGKVAIRRGDTFGGETLTEQFSGVAAEIRKLPDDRMKRQRILKILRAKTKPILKAVKENTPVADKDIEFRGKLYPKGNLKKSMAIKTSPLKNYPNVLIGPRQGNKHKFDGWYAFLIQYGSLRHQPNDFIGKAAAPIIPKVQRSLSATMETEIYNEAKKLNL